MFKKILFMASFLYPLMGSASGARDFTSLSEIHKESFYRITCSDDASEIQAHVYVEIQNNKVNDLKILSLAPGRSLSVLQYNAKKAQGLKVSFNRELLIHGENPGAYWNETFQLELKDSPGGLQGNLTYDDGDGVHLRREQMKCGATNYLLFPNS